MTNWRGTWNSGAIYAPGDEVSYAGTVWVCDATATGQVPVPGAYWTPQPVLLGPEPPATPSAEGVIALAGDLGGTAASPEVVSAHLTSPLLPAQGGAGTFSPMTYGATGNGTTNDTTAVQAAYAAAAAANGIVDITGYQFLCTSPIPLSSYTTTRGGNIGAASGPGSIINNTTDLFSVTGSVVGVAFDGGYYSASAGHVFNAGTSACALWTFRNATLIQGGNFCLWYMTGGGIYLDMDVGEGCYLSGYSGSTISPWYIAVSSNGANCSRWHNFRCTGNSSSVPFFHIENTAAGYADNNSFRDITAELCPAGIITALSASHLSIDNVVAYDVATYTGHIFTIGQGSGSGLNSRIVSIRCSGWTGGALGGGVYDVSAPSVSGLVLENVGPQSTGYAPVYSVPSTAAILGLGGPVYATVNDPLKIGVAVSFFPGAIQQTASVNTANNGCYSKLVSGGYAFSHLNINVGASSGNISAAVYTNSGTGMSAAPTGAQLSASGAIACPAIGVAAVALGGSVTPNLGDWVALSADNTTATFQRPETTSTLAALSLPGWGSLQASAHPLPSTPSGLSASGSIGNFMMRGS